MQSFDREVQSLIFLGNKATDTNKSDNCEECKHQNQIVAETFFDPTCNWIYCMSKTAINADDSTSEKLQSAILYLNNQASDHHGSYVFLVHLFTLF